MSLRKYQNRVSEEEAPMKQGIVAILNSDGSERAPTAASIRRTLSADMSSKKWLEQNGMKKIVSSEELIKLPVSDSSSSEGEDECEKHKSEWKPPPLTDVWNSILLCRKGGDHSGLPTPYVHPLVIRSSSGLSEKSLEICTESLGSETGSDCFSPYTPRSEDREIRISEEELKEANQFGDAFGGAAVAPKFKESAARPSPPPIRCISGGYGASIHMNSRRENGRLVVEAVSVPPKNCFQVQRCDGRLVLSLVHVPAVNPQMAEEEEDDDDVADLFEDIEEAQEESADGGGDEDDDEVAEEEFPVEQSPSDGIVSAQKPTVAMKNLMAIGNRNRTWSTKANVAAEEEEFTIPQSLQPLPRISRLIPSHPPTAASFNAYDYFWRNVAAVPAGGAAKNRRQTNDRNPEWVIMSPYLKGYCREGRRSLLIWEPFQCIATT